MLLYRTHKVNRRNIGVGIHEEDLEQIIVNKLHETDEIEDAKNALLPIVTALILAQKGVTILHNVSILSDVF